MPVGKPESLSYRWPLAILILIMAVYGWRVLEQYTNLNSLHERQLGAAASELKRALENAAETVTRLDASKPGSLCAFDVAQPYLEFDNFSGACEEPAGKSLAGVKVSLQNGLAIEAVGTSPANTPKQVRFRFRTDQLLSELQSTEEFGILLLADPNGRVLYQEAPALRRWRRYLRWGEQTFRDATAPTSSTVQIRDVPGLLGADAKTEWPALHAASSQSTLRLGTDRHQAYFQPVMLGGPDNPELVLGGFIPTQSVLREALALDTYMMAVLLFILLFGSLGFPFIKLAVLDRHERFRVRDVYLLMLSTGALLSLLTMLVLCWDAYARWSAEASAGLAVFADSVEKGVRKEVTEIQSQLAGYDQQANAGFGDCIPPVLALDWFASSSPRLPFPERAVYLEQVAWLDETGGQIWKVSGRRSGRLNSVSARAYFRSVRDGHLFQMPGWQGGPMFLGPEWSITDGKFYTFVSFPSKWTKPACGKTDGAKTGAAQYVIVATAKLLSLDRPALPAGYGIAIINRDGRVMHHSDNRVSLRENFFDEMGDGGRAKAIVFAGRSETVTDTYRERSHEIYFRPLGDTAQPELQPNGADHAGFYVAVFRDLAMERSAVAHALITSLGGPMSLLLLIMAAALWVMSRAGGPGKTEHKARRATWLWPREAAQPVYRILALAFGAICVGGLVLYLLGANHFVFAAMPIAALVAGVYGMSRIGLADQPRQKLEGRRWFTLQCCLLLLALVVIPAAAVFGLLVGHEYGKTIETEQSWILGQRADARLALQAEMRADEQPKWVGERVAAVRETYQFTPPKPFDAMTLKLGGGGRWMIRSLQTLDHALLPIESDLVARQRFQPASRVYSPPGLLGLPVSWIGIAGLLAILGLLVWWLGWGTTRIVLADLDSPTATIEQMDPEQLWGACTPEQRQLLIQVAHERIANPRQREVVEGLLANGLLRFAPDLQPGSVVFERFLLTREKAMADEVLDWEEADGQVSWHYVRNILFVALGVLAVFLFATQPGLQSSVMGFAGGAAVLLEVSMKFRDAVGSWFTKRKA